MQKCGRPVCHGFPARHLCLAGARPGSMMCGSFLLPTGVAAGPAELGEAWWNSERPGDSGGRAGVYGIAVPTEAGGPTGRAGSSDITKIAAAGLFFW